MARLTRTSIFNPALERTLEFSLYDQEEFEKRYRSYRRGELTIDEAFPEASRNLKSFILYGATEEEVSKALRENNEPINPIL